MLTERGAEPSFVKSFETVPHTGPRQRTCERVHFLHPFPRYLGCEARMTATKLTDKLKPGPASRDEEDVPPLVPKDPTPARRAVMLLKETRGARISPSGTAPPWKPSIQIALCYVIQAMLLVALIGPAAMPIAMPFLLFVLVPLHMFAWHLYLHDLHAIPRAVHLCILPVTLIMGIVSAIVLGVEFMYLPLSLLCLTVGIRLCSCSGIPSSERLKPSHLRGTSPAVSSEEAQAAARRYLGHDEVWKALEGDGVKESERPVRLCLLYTSPSPRDRTRSRMPSSA